MLGSEGEPHGPAEAGLNALEPLNGISVTKHLSSLSDNTLYHLFTRCVVYDADLNPSIKEATVRSRFLPIVLLLTDAWVLFITSEDTLHVTLRLQVGFRPLHSIKCEAGPILRLHVGTLPCSETPRPFWGLNGKWLPGTQEYCLTASSVSSS